MIPALIILLALPVDATHYDRLADSVAQTVEAQCDTDTDCLALCPASEPECDGGPQPEPMP